jgi:hypothetical protein
MPSQAAASYVHVDEHRDRGVSAGIRNTLCHFLHDERIPNDSSAKLCALQKYFHVEWPDRAIYHT